MNKIPSETEEIAKRLEEGVRDVFHSQKYMDYLKVMSQFHEYSLNNTLLIMMQRPSASIVAGYNAWKQMGRRVNRGEKGIRILAPSPYTLKVEQTQKNEKGEIIKDQKGNAVKEIVEIKKIAFRPVSVFDVEQTAGKELPQLTSALIGTSEKYRQIFTAISKVSDIPIVTESITGSQIKGYCTRDKIVLNESNSDLQNLKTLVHELAHHKLHFSPENELKGDTFSEVKKVHIKKCKNYTSKSEKNSLLEVKKLHTNYKENNYKDIASYLDGNSKSFQKKENAILKKQQRNEKAIHRLEETGLEYRMSHKPWKHRLIYDKEGKRPLRESWHAGLQDDQIHVTRNIPVRGRLKFQTEKVAYTTRKHRQRLQNNNYTKDYLRHRLNRTLKNMKDTAMGSQFSEDEVIAEVNRKRRLITRGIGWRLRSDVRRLHRELDGYQTLKYRNIRKDALNARAEQLRYKSGIDLQKRKVEEAAKQKLINEQYKHKLKKKMIREYKHEQGNFFVRIRKQHQLKKTIKKEKQIRSKRTRALVASGIAILFLVLLVFFLIVFFMMVLLDTGTGNGQQVYGPVMDVDWRNKISSNYGERIHPITGKRIFHDGVDIAVPVGTTLYSPVMGTVVASHYSDSAGNMVTIQTETGWLITFMHMDSRTVQAGERIERGQQVGFSGNTGNSTGPHLHIRVHDAEGNSVNPVFIIPFSTIEASES